MKQANSPISTTANSGNSGRHILLLMVMALYLTSARGQLSYTFTNASATGSMGPTQTQVTNAYASGNLNGLVNCPSGIQQFTVPIGGGWRIEARGAQGGGAAGGRGAMMSGDFTLTAGQVLNILVGQQGQSYASDVNISGGGGSYVVSGGNYLIIAGGGGAARSAYSTADGTVTANANNGYISTSTLDGTGGTSGAGGGGASCRGGGGAGWNSAGGVGSCGTPGGQGGIPFASGGYGGGISSTGVVGGFGGGGSSEGVNTAWTYAGGGGGYSGGGGASTGDQTPRGGGGGSINNGLNQTNASGSNSGNGLVIITSLCNVAVNGPSLICSGSSATLTTNAVSNYSWSTGNTTSSVIVVSPNVTTTYSVSGIGTSPAGCSSSGIITVTVSPGVPTLAVTSSTPSTCLGNTVSISVSGANSYTFSGGIGNGTTFTPAVGVNNYSISGANGCGITTTVVPITITQLAVGVSATSTLVCAGKPTTLTASGANNYTWTPGASNFTNYIVNPSASTVYTLTGLTGNCMGTHTLAITTQANPTLAITTSNTMICEGDMVNLSVNGNATTYSWSPTGQMGLSTSDTPANTILYTVTGTNVAGCASYAQQVVIVNPLPVMSVSASNQLVCSTYPSTLSASGASTYVWTGGPGSASSTMAVNPVTDATYTVTGTNSLSCSASTIITVNVYAPTVVVTNNTVVCVGKNVSIGAGAADSWLWSNGATSQNITVNPTLTTVYTVTASVNNLNGLACPATNTVMVTVNPSPSVTISSNHTVICIGNAAILTAGGTGANGTYTWTGGSTSVISLNNTVSPIADQGYTVTATDENGCNGKATYVQLVSPCTGIAVNQADMAMLIYPNPSTGEFIISGNQIITLQISNELGQLVKEVSLTKNNSELRVNDLPGGIYMISGANENGRVKQKIVITK